ncbi:MAG: hypothetical protein V4556_05080 [Bacteroidota bacterium]
MKKYLIIVFLFLLAPFHKMLAQDVKDIAGVWKGTIYNDTTQKHYPYQIVISEDGGKLSGYSYTVYDIDGKPEVGVRKIKIKRKANQLTIEDDALIYNDYTEAPPKGVRKISIVNINVQDTLMTIAGEWHSNRTKKYLPLSGTLQVQKKYDYKPTELFKKLEELKLDNALSFTPKPEKATPKEDVVVISKTVSEKKVRETVAKEKIKDTPVVAAVKPKKEKKEKEIVVKEKKRDTPVVATIKPKPEKKAKEVAVKEKKVEVPVKPVVIPPANEIAKRKIVTMQEVFYKSDSLTLTLYDNGDVDGDVVTLLANGEIIFAKAPLTTQPTRKTIYINKSTPDSLLLLMFAENLGSIPPNTGLLVVNDGNDVYEVRFSADLQTNAGIILRRRKNN